MSVETSIRFLGAARNVTGSSYLVEHERRRVLVDCGLYQERKFRERNWAPLAVDPGTIDAVLLTHAHLDHCGLLPKLVREGFKGPIFCTPATAEIARIVLLDSARIQEEDAEFKRRRHEREDRIGPYPEQPLYSEEDAEATLPLFRTVGYTESTAVAEGIAASFHEAGHILGSTMIRLELNGTGAADRSNEGRSAVSRSIVFSGDIGQWDKPIIEDPTVFSDADYLVMESTYGDRNHEDPGEIEELLAAAVNTTHRAGGNLLIPSFALERTQEVLYYLNRLLRLDRIPHLMVFVDSPMAISVTEVFKDHPELFDESMRKLLEAGHSPFSFAGLKMTRSVDQSKAINHIRGTSIIIAGSGMCTGGRIKHHLVHNISRKESTVLFVGYQAEGTLGREILSGAKEVRILGKSWRRKAGIRRISGFSAHADQGGLLRWLGGLKRPPRRLFLTHGEADAIRVLSAKIEREKGWQPHVPEYGERVTLD
ncbi:MAG: MBL fold metallo-hydrolase [Spirochaetaceae bacterium]|nr:MAG: MBL fold metallo-hydrolase [Spirochaetaceae bacterium]